MRIHAKLPLSINTNGPGRRAVIWVQGCALGCAGCWNQETHSFDGGTEVNPFDLADWVSSVRDGLEGVTFSGGEPLHQPMDLSIAMSVIRKQWPDVSFGLFTGYSQAELDAGRYKCWPPVINSALALSVGVDAVQVARARWWQTEIRPCLDFAVMGRYNQQQPDTRPMCSSKNQELVLFSDRYKLSDFAPQRVEMVIHESGDLVSVTGFPTTGVPL